MCIIRNWKLKTFYINQHGYILKILETFYMQNSKPDSLPIITGYDLDVKDDDSNDILTNIPYDKGISIIYSMIYPKLHIA